MSDVDRLPSGPFFLVISSKLFSLSAVSTHNCSKTDGIKVRVREGVLQYVSNCRTDKMRKTVMKILTSANSIKFAAFLSSMVAAYKVIEYLSMLKSRLSDFMYLQLVNSVLYYLPVSRDLRLLLAGEQEER